MTDKKEYTPGPSGINRRTKQKNARKKFIQRQENLAKRADNNKRKK